jgi:hypothetical protein
MADPTDLPSTRDLLTGLISTIATSTQHEQGSANPLSNACPNTKSALLTLHTLFPNDLLPALDLLDRGLVTRFVLASDSNKPPEQAEHAQASHSELNDAGRKQTIAYYVRTAQKPSSRSRAAQATTSYEVHLTAWSCSCPAFAFAAFPASLPLDNSVSYTAMEQDEAAEGDWFRETGWRFGGLTRGNDVPTCKHLLACMIAEKCGGFARLVEEKEVGVEEAAGWAAGWGD